MNRTYFHERFGGQAEVGDMPEIVLLISDPLASSRLSSRLEQSTPVADHYEFQAYHGVWEGVPVGICSTGIGGGSASIAFDELCRLGGRTFIYLGLGPAREHESAETEFQIAAGAVRADGASLDYVLPSFPAVAHPEVVLALSSAARRFGYSASLGLFLAYPNELAREHTREEQENPESLLAGVPNFNLPILPAASEVGSILTQGALYRFRTGAVQFPVSQLKDVRDTEDRLFRLGLQAAVTLHAWDQEKAHRGWQMMTPEV